MSANNVKGINEQSSLKLCSMCKDYFPESMLKHNKCPKCTELFLEWKNGRPKTAEEKKKYKGIRAHYDIPIYKKVYSVYQYDQQKYTGIWRKIQKLSIKYGKHIYDRVNPYRVLELCYIKKEGKLVHLKDERHIFRYPALHKICAKIANTLTEKHHLEMDETTIEYLKRKTGIVYYADEKEPTAEFEKAITMPLRERIRVAIRLLRLLNIDQISIESATLMASNLDKKLPKNKQEIEAEALLIDKKTKDESIEEISAEKWEKVHLYYRAGYSVKDLSDRFGIAKSTILDKAQKDGWVRNCILREQERKAKEEQARLKQLEETKQIINGENLKECVFLLTEEEEQELRLHLKRIRVKNYTFRLNEEQYEIVSSVIKILKGEK